MRRIRLSVLFVVGLVASAAFPAGAGPFPERISLPDGSQPEGIAVAPGGDLYVGSIPTGAIFAGNVRSDTVSTLVDGGRGRAAIGLALDRTHLYVAGGPTGQAYVYDARTGSDVASYQLTTDETFINDVVVTKDAAFFTDSINQVLYKVPKTRNGAPGDEVVTLALGGDIVFVEGFNANGIDATPSGQTLVIVQSNTGMLFTVDPDDGTTRTIDLGGEDVTNGDGILLDGRNLYVVQNRLNLVAKVRLAPDLSSGDVESRTTSEDFDVPTTVDEFGNRLYLVNARFSTPPTPETEYWVTQIAKP